MTDTVFSQGITVLIQQPIMIIALPNKQPQTSSLDHKLHNVSCCHKPILILVAITSVDLSGITPTGVTSGGLPVTPQRSTHFTLSHLELFHSLSGDLPVASTLSFFIPPVVTCRGKATCYHR